ncbi:MAG: addiction module antidote protein [Roseiarcus sp.]|jgi:probable addiction module antidote protein
MVIETTIWDPTERLTSPEAEFAYLEAAFEDGDPSLIAAAIGDIARARGMAQIAKAAGLSRETMYKAFSAEGNPTLETLAGVTKALGYRLKIAPAA